MALTIPEEQDLDTARELAHWLEESGRRKRNLAWVSSLAQTERQVVEEAAVDAQARSVYITQPALLSLFAMASASFLLYYFAVVNLKILSIWSVVVFVAA